MQTDALGNYRLATQDVIADIKAGMMIKELELDGFFERQWFINLSYLLENGASKTQPSLKYTLYTDYATQYEKQQTQLITLENISEERTIDTIINPSTYEN